jgi:hypothetical protein
MVHGVVLRTILTLLAHCSAALCNHLYYYLFAIFATLRCQPPPARRLVLCNPH